MVITSVLSGVTNGNPYKTQKAQFRIAARYGSGLNSSTDFFLMIRQKVGLQIKGK